MGDVPFLNIQYACIKDEKLSLFFVNLFPLRNGSFLTEYIMYNNLLCMN